MAEAVKVAVRVRPFNGRERERGAQLVIEMQGATTIIKDPSNMSAEGKKFAFDYSYWSHDGYEEAADGELVATSPQYATQMAVFNDVGVGVLNNAWEGYNCSLFAYGQTGSGKSYSMVGYGVNKGIVPITCDELFKGITEKRGGAGTTYKVTLSMLEIYNEQVRDLLSKKKAPKGGLKVRQHPKKGFYVEGLMSLPVSSYEDIDNKIAEGTEHRTVAATQMNATSSRAHTVVTIAFTQVSKNDSGAEMAKTSTINLVDLAGSERADSTGATGDRLKEGSAINQSLSALGNVISALADKATGKKGAIVPFRDSALTKLLQNALGGNSKTVMIAALSPAGINYEETVSTLRFADRAKKIKTKATINENPMEKLIRELKEENDRLKAMMGGELPVAAAAAGGGGGATMTPEQIEKMRKEMEEEIRQQLLANESEARNMNDWEGAVKEQQQATSAAHDERAALAKRKEDEPHFSNLNEDTQLSGVVLHFVKKGTNKVGKRAPEGEPQPDIALSGLSILPLHAEVKLKGGEVSLKPATKGAKILVNGEACTARAKLADGDCVMFGSNHLFRFTNPGAPAGPDGKVKVTSWEDAQKQVAANSGFEGATAAGGGSAEDLLLQEDLIALMPMVNEANAMSEELNKKVIFEIALMSPSARGLTEGRTEVWVKMRSLLNDNSWMWKRSKFLNRKYIMQEMYQGYAEGAEDWDLSQEKDPFWEPVDANVLVGSVHVYLQSLSYLIELDETLSITNYKGAEQGNLSVEIIPCKADFSEITEEDDMFVDEPAQLVGKDVHFKLKLKSACGLPAKFSRGVFCKYKFYLEETARQTDTKPGPNPSWGYEERFSFAPATKQFVDYLADQVLLVEVWGMQSDRVDHKGKADLTTRELVDAAHAGQAQRAVLTGGGSQVVMGKGGKLSAADTHRVLCENATLQRRVERAAAKQRRVEHLLQKAVEGKQSSVAVEELQRAVVGEAKTRFKAVAKVVQHAVGMEMQAKKAGMKTFDKKNVSSACSIQ